MPTPRFWKPIVRPIRDSEDVSAAIANRAIQDQTDRENWLFNAIQSLNLSSGRVVRSNVPVSDTTTVNDIVYFDETNGCWAPALAEVIYEDGVPQAGPRSFGAGIALSVGGGFANVLLLGHILFGGEEGEYTIDPLSMLDTQESVFQSGVYYLSRKQAGKISRVPSAPVTQLGWIGITGMTWMPVYKDIFETHFHHAFDLYARPAASQNYAKTGWHQFADDGANRKFVDYFNRNTNTAPPAIIASIRWTGADEPAPVRVEIYRSSATEFSVNLVKGIGLDYDNPTSSGIDTEPIVAAPWPEYGEWVAIGNTGLEVAFLRWDENYANSLTDDAASLITLTTDIYRIFLPDDLHGWTNANGFDLTTPAEMLYRYVKEGQKDLDRAFPPLPLESAIVEVNGASMKVGVDFDITLDGVWWLPTPTDPDLAPWPNDFVADGSTMDPVNARNMRLYFAKATSANVDSQVRSLKSVSPALVIKDCVTGAEAQSGDLSIGLDLAMNVDTDVTEGHDLAVVGVNGETLLVGPSVTELVEGPGILLTVLSTSQIPNTNRKIGKIRVSRKDVALEGEVSSIALRGAGEVIKENFAYVSFPPPASRSSAIIARFKIPAAGLTTGAFNVNLFAQALGSASSATLKNAIFKLTYQAMRPGFSLSNLVESKALSVQYWPVAFGPTYTGLTVLAGELPTPVPATPDVYTISTANIGGLSPVLPAGLKDGDIISVLIERVSSDATGGTDDYEGDVGITGLRWTVTT